MNNVERAKKFLENYEFTIDPITGCKIGNYYIQNNGYIKVEFGGKYTHLHRVVAVAYLNLDLDDTNVQVCHKRECPNKHCFNENHLYIGSAYTNTNDYMSTGKHHEKSKLLCDKGHRLNRIIRTVRDGKVRYCSICRRESQLKFRLSKKK